MSPSSVQRVAEISIRRWIGQQEATATSRSREDERLLAHLEELVAVGAALLAEFGRGGYKGAHQACSQLF